MKFFIHSLLVFTSCAAMADGFVKGTLVKVANGYQTIESLKEGDHVVSCNIEGEQCVETPILATEHHLSDSVVEVAIYDQPLRLEAEHTIYSEINREFFPAETLEHKKVDGQFEVFNITVDETHNYYVTTDDILVHNWAALFRVGPTASSAAKKAATAAAAEEAVFAGLSETASVVDQVAGQSSIQKAYANSMANQKESRAPGMPTSNDGYEPPKKWDGKKVHAPNGRGYGYPDKNGNIWVPSGVDGHAGPHWDVQSKNGKQYANVAPGGKIRGSDMDFNGFQMRGFGGIGGF